MSGSYLPMTWESTTDSLDPEPDKAADLKCVESSGRHGNPEPYSI